MNDKYIIVSDTSSLIYLMKIRSLSLLGRLYSKVYIPKEVFKELTRNPKFPDENELIKRMNFIKTIEVKDKEAVDNLIKESFIEKNKIHQGEAEAIILAKELKINKILINDKNGEIAASNSHLETLEATEIFVEAFKKEIIDEDDIERISLVARQNKHLLPEGFSEEIRNIPNEHVKGCEF